MTLLKRQALWTLVTLFFLGGGLHFFLEAFDAHRRQKTRLEKVHFRRDFTRRQIAELQQKVKVIEQVNGFVKGAENLGLVPDNWTRYDVNIEAPLRFAALSEILRQCRSTPYYYFQPQHLRVHLAGGRGVDAEKVDASGAPSEMVVASADSDSTETGDLLLQLKGVFLARRR